MISTVEITIEKQGTKKIALLVCESLDITIKFTPPDGSCRTYKGSNFYTCFGQLREDNQDIKFFCKGAKINVHPSSMSAQMSLGLKAYELNLGKAAHLSDVVYIFDYEDSHLTNNPQEQRDFYKRWIEQEKTDDDSSD